jgi:hypothetical protein
MAKYPVRAFIETPISQEDEDIANKLIEIIEGCRNSSVIIETSDDLDFDDD